MTVMLFAANLYTMLFRVKYLFILCFLPSLIHAQEQRDTFSITLAQAEHQFLENNLILLSQQYNINAQRAFVLQAKLYPNPNINITQGAYNTQTGKWFQTDKHDGEQALQIQQLIVLAGKIRKQTKIVETNVELAEFNFYDVMRNLKVTLRNDFYAIYYLQETAKVYTQEIQSLEQIRSAFEQQREKGYIARTEVVRIKAQLYSLKSELSDLRNQINDKESELRLIVQVPPGVYFIPQVDTSKVINESPRSFSLQSLLDSAYQNRPDLLIANGNTRLFQENYDFQKSLAVPDLTLGANYDKHGSYINNFNAVSLGFNVPLFNRNQGNIKAYKILIKVNSLQAQNVKKVVEEQVYRALQKAIDADKLYQGLDKGFTGEFAHLARGVYESYVKRNIGLLDFLIFYDSYKQFIVQQNTILQNRIGALENINFLTNSNFFNK
jgi:cobalt-zinc-cadmium efflux system outer membrane protein